jgi:hypothetical protein
MKAVLTVGAALALFAGPLAYAAEEVEPKAEEVEPKAEEGEPKVEGRAHIFLPHNTPYTPCAVTIQHGNVFAAAYAKITVHNTQCKQISATVIAKQNGRPVSASTGLIRNPVPGQWYQATRNWSSLEGSRWFIRDERGGDTVYSFRGI